MNDIEKNDIVECICYTVEPDDMFQMRSVHSGNKYTVVSINVYFGTVKLLETGTATFPIGNFKKYIGHKTEEKSISYCRHQNKYLSKWLTFEFTYCPDCKKEV